jgi:aldehyde dehydrogenase (NAD+)
MITNAVETGFHINTFREQAARIYAAQQRFFASGATRPYAFRKAQLKTLKSAVRDAVPQIVEAMHRDLRKSEFEAIGTEVGPVLNDIRHTLANLRDWMRPQPMPTPLMFFPSRSKVYPDPLGMVLNISPWNYPFLLAISPLVSAIAGGNTVILKPSEESPHTSQVIENLVRQHFPEEYIAVVQGPGHIVGAELIEQYHFDHIFFTGSVAVGKRIMQMAARHLSPVTLELGGKSPCIIEPDAKLDYAARKVAWSKIINAGQTCVAPDYVLVHESVREAFVEKLRASFRSMLGDDPRQSPDYGRLINRKRFEAIEKLMHQGEITYGGDTDAEALYIAPTIIEQVSADDPVMQEEIFGPVLPVISYRTRDEVLQWIERHPYPLAFYIYTSRRATADFYINQVRFGGGCVNNGLIHLGNPDIPFGGVGYSGLGQYHGRHGFDTFTRPKSVLTSPTWFDAPLWYAPYRDTAKWIRKIFRV